MKVYADHAATAPLRREALAAMTPYLTEFYGNPSSIYSFAAAAREAVDDARIQVAAALNAEPGEIIFNGGGTEGDNFAVKGALAALEKKGRHVITSAIEHHAILRQLQYLEEAGQCELTVLPVDEYGLVSAEELKNAIRPDTVLVTIMFANNEIGTIQPVTEIGAVCRERGVWFHTDAVQAVGHVPVDVKAMNIDMLSLAAHKFGGPKGVGAFYLRKGVKIPALLHGGGHERGLRSGTENVAGIAGLAAALKLAAFELKTDAERLRGISGYLIKKLSEIPYSRLTGHPTKRLPGTVSFVFEAVEGESLVLGLDMKGICASSGSACSSASLDPSHVLLAAGIPHEIAHGSLRLSFGHDTTMRDAQYVAKAVEDSVRMVRERSALWSDGKPTMDLWKSTLED